MKTRKYAGSPILLIFVILFFQSCDNPFGTSTPKNQTQKRDHAPASATFEIFEQGDFNAEYSYKLIRIDFESFEKHGYAAFIYPKQASSQVPLFLTMHPYQMIPWTGEDSDKDPIVDPFTVQEIFDAAHPYLINGYATLSAFSRFYLGESIEFDISVLDQALLYLEQESQIVDPDRVALYGASYGGFQVIHSTIRSTNITPALTVAFYPAIEFQWFIGTHIQQSLPLLVTPQKFIEYENFYDPYLSKIYKTTGGPPGEGDYSKYNASHVAQGLDNKSTQLYILHDESDAIVPFEISSNLYSLLSKKPDKLWYYQQDPVDYQNSTLDHNPRDPGLSFDTGLFMLQAYVHSRLIPDASSIKIFFNSAETLNALDHFHQMDQVGKPPSDLFKRLIELVEPNVTLIDIHPNARSGPGSAVISDLLNSSSFNPGVSSDTVKTYLQDRITNP